jgi:hypothetical protein
VEEGTDRGGAVYSECHFDAEVRMKKLLLLLALAVAAIAVPAAVAGGWATLGLSSLPTGTPPGKTWPVDLTVLQHGRTPLEGIAPVLTITNGDGDSRAFTATPTGKPGVYHADVVFPTEGTWSYQIWDDFSQTHTFKPVEIAAPAGGSFPLIPLAGAFGLALALAALTVAARRRRQPGPEPIRLKEAA